MKKIIIILFALAAFKAKAQEHAVVKLWETDTIIAIPESVLPDVKKRILFVSLINGGSWVADGKGGVGKLNWDGTHFDSTWITGLNAPKGLGRWNNRLYVADISEVVVINIKQGKIETRISIDSAQGLNDITVSDKGIVYVSDSKTAKIWRIEKDKPSLYLDNMKGVNGLKWINGELIIASGKSFVKATAQKQLIPIAALPQGGDGVEPVGNGDFLVTAWNGFLFYVHADGKVETLLDTHAEKKNMADIGFDAAKKIIFIPTFNAKTVMAYQLK